MPARIIYTSLEEIPENLRPNATKLDGDAGYQLDGDGLIRKNTELLGEVSGLRALANKFKDLGDNPDVNKIKTALAEYESAGQREADITRRIQAAVQDANKTFSAKEQTYTTQLAGLRSALETQLIDNVLTSEITSANGDPFFVLPQLRGSVKVVQDANNGGFTTQVVDNKGTARFNSKAEPMSIKELVAEARQDQKFASVFKAPVASGSGSQGTGAGATGGGAGMGNAQGTVNLTRADARNAQVYQAALKQVNNDPSRVVFTD